MSASSDFARKILFRRMIEGLEKEGYRVEFAEEYHGYIVAGRGEDPPVMLLEADTIERCRSGNPGSPSGFVKEIVLHVKKQISSTPSTSYAPPQHPVPASYQETPPAPPPVHLATDEEVAAGIPVYDENSMPEPEAPPEPKRGPESESTEEIYLEEFKG